jgi:hypothetical protein
MFDKELPPLVNKDLPNMVASPSIATYQLVSRQFLLSMGIFLL